MRLLATLILIACTGLSHAGQYWTEDKTTNALLIANNALLLADCLQTHDIANNPDEFHETGLSEKLIGEHPTSGDVTRSCVFWFTYSNGLAYILPERSTLFGVEFNPKKLFIIFDAGINAYTVAENARIGLHFDIP